MPRPTIRIDYLKPVAYLTGTGNYTRLHYADGSLGIFGVTLKKVLSHYPNLIRIHKHAAVNPQHVTYWNFKNQHEAKVRVVAGGNTDLFAISRRRVRDVKARLAELQLPNQATAASDQ